MTGFVRLTKCLWFDHSVPTVMEKHGENLVVEKSWKMGKK